MPLYTIMTQAGALDAERKADLARRLTDLHAQYADVPKKWVHVVFQDYAPGSGFAAGDAAATVALTLLIRNGRSQEYKRKLLQQLWDLLQEATGVPDDQLVLAIQELPASQAMEMGKTMVDVPS